MDDLIFKQIRVSELSAQCRKVLAMADSVGVGREASGLGEIKAFVLMVYVSAGIVSHPRIPNVVWDVIL